MGTSFISIKDVASAQFEFRVEDWVDRSRRARELALSINGYEVSPSRAGTPATGLGGFGWRPTRPAGGSPGATSGYSSQPMR